MNVTVETTPESDAQFHVEIPWDEIDKTSDRVYKRVAQNQKIPGFRPGHAPRALVERAVGKDAIYEEAIDIIVQDAIRISANEHELTLLATPHAHVHDIKYGENHDVTITVPVLAKGELADYHDIHVEQEPVSVNQEDIDAVIGRARDQMALWVPVDRPTQLGDRITVDLKLTAGEKDISNLKDNEFDLVAERNGLFTGMDAHIVGMTEGETKEFDTIIPEDYLNTELAGKTAHFTITLNKIAIKELPAIDDEFAKQAGNFESVAVMYAAVRADLQQSRATTAARQARDALINAVIERLTLSVPQVLIEAETDDILQDLANMLARERINLNQYLQLMGKQPDEYREEMKPEAERRIKQRRALELVAAHEGITVTPSEIQTLLDEYARSGGARSRFNQLKPSQRLSIERSLLRDKALAQLAEQAITVPDAATEEAAIASAPDDAPVAIASPAESDVAVAASAPAREVPVAATTEATPADTVTTTERAK